MTLVDEARQCWRLWSVRLAAVAGGLAAALVSDPTILTGLVAYVPAYWRPAAATLAGLTVFAAPTLVRLIKQEEKTNGQ